MLRFENLGKRYGDHVVFQGLCFETGAGCFVATGDETGSGRTTLLSVLGGTVQPDDGEVWLAGHSLRSAPVAAQAALAYIPDDCLAYPLLTGREWLDREAAARNTAVDAATLELAERFALGPHLDKRFEQMSLGTRKKIYLTALALGNAPVVIADEPSGGLDGAARAVLIDLFTTLGHTRVVFFASHDAALIRGCGAQSVGFADLGVKR